MKLSRQAVSCVAISTAMLFSAPVAAQDAQASSNNDGALDEIVVTAQRRAESLKDVPIAVSTISGVQAQATGLVDTTSLNGRIPSLTISTQGSGNLLFLRGIGTANTASNAEMSVATYIDGVYIYSANGNLLPLYDLERIEVLKGPQGTLFGRNATAGVIQLITRDPEREPTIEGDIGYGNYETVRAHAYAATGLTDSLAMNVAIDYRDQGKGWGFNPVLNEKAYFSNYIAGRAKLVYEPSDATEIKAAFHYNHAKTSGFEAQRPRGLLTADGVISDFGRYIFRGSQTSRQDTKNYLGSLTINQDLGFARLVSISAYADVKIDYQSDADYSPAIIVDAHNVHFAKNFSQELQLQSPDNAPFDWLVGAYYFKAKAGYDPIGVVGAGAAPFSAIEVRAAQKTGSFALFGQVTVPVTDTTKITGGFRYTWEDIRRVDASFSGDGVLLLTGADQKKKINTPTWRVAIDQHFTDDVMGYVSYTRGSKTGGYNITAGPGENPPYTNESLDSYEVGLKADAFERRLRFSAAAFLYKYKDIQVNLTLGPSLLVQNAARATIKGIDAEVTVRPVRNLTLSGSIGYVDAKFDSYAGAVIYSALGGASTTFDASGRTVPYAMKWSGTFDATYVIEAAIGKFDINANASFASKKYVEPENRLALPGYSLVNGSIGWTAPDEHWGLRFWANNLFDRKYLVAGLSGGVGDFVLPSPPRTYGVTAKFAF